MKHSEQEWTPRTYEQIRRDHLHTTTLRGLVDVLNEKLQMRARYALLEYEAGMEGRSDCSELYRALSRTESQQIEQLSTMLSCEFEPQRTDPPRSHPSA